jgi:hypothetical protein
MSLSKVDDDERRAARRRYTERTERARGVGCTANRAAVTESTC